LDTEGGVALKLYLQSVDWSAGLGIGSEAVHEQLIPIVNAVLDKLAASSESGELSINIVPLLSYAIEHNLATPAELTHLQSQASTEAAAAIGALREEREPLAAD
jgi:hypothetical protein